MRMWMWGLQLYVIVGTSRYSGDKIRINFEYVMLYHEYKGGTRLALVNDSFIDIVEEICYVDERIKNFDLGKFKE